MPNGMAAHDLVFESVFVRHFCYFAHNLGYDVFFAGRPLRAHWRLYAIEVRKAPRQQH